MTTYKIYCETGFAGGRHEDTVSIEDLGYSEEEWSELNSEEIEKILDDYVAEWVNSYIESGWEEVEE